MRLVYVQFPMYRRNIDTSFTIFTVLCFVSVVNSTTVCKSDEATSKDDWTLTALLIAAAF
jgi:hypothetical protein